VGYSVGDLVDQTLVEAWNGVSWSMVTSADTSDAQANVLNSISCTSSTACEAVGEFSDGSAYQTLIEQWNGAAWSTTPSPSTSTSHQNDLDAVSCASTSICDAAGAFNDGSFNQTLIVESDIALPYTAVTPTRICDTRAVQTGVVANQCNHSGASAGTLTSGSTINVTVTGGNVPTTATAVILNVAVTGTTASSFLSVYPTGSPRSTASNLNWTPGTTIPNLVEVPVGNNGQVTVYNLAGSADVIIDVEGYVAAGANSYTGLYNPLTPARICDTRAVQTGVVANQCNNNGVGTGTLGAGATKVITIDGQGGVPVTGVAAVALNIAVTGTTASSFLAAYPDLTTKTSASNLNWVAGQTIPNRVVVPVGTNGKIDLYNFAGSADVIVDVSGWYTDSSNTAATGSLYVPIAPTRICDTRVVQAGVVANQCNHDGVLPGTLAAHSTLPVEITGLADVPNQASAAVLNVAVTNTTASSFLSVWPDGISQPTASDLNWVANQTIPNLVIATLPTSGPDTLSGLINLYNLAGSADVVIDVEGFYIAEPA
jgi:hypothetical protein